MAEETHGTAIEANTADASNTSAAEPVILEEHIVAPPPKPASAAVADSAPVTAPQAPLEVTPVPPQPTPASSGVFAKILSSVKIPERISPAAPEVKPGRTYDTALGADAMVMAEKQMQVRTAARAVVESLPHEAPKGDDVRPLRTLKDDLQDVVKTRKISFVRAVALEEEKRHRPAVEATLQAAPTRRRIAPLVALALFFLGAAMLGGTYYVISNRTVTTAVAPAHILFAEQSAPLDVTDLAPDDVKREIANARGTGLTLGAILEILLTRRDPTTNELVPISFGDFVRSIGAHPPDELTRALGDDFFFGLHTVDENAPVIVVPVTSYEHAFAAMLTWERTLNRDLAPIFTAVSTQTLGASGLPVERTFQDIVIRNYDVRALTDENGTVQLYYSFPTRNILIIAESQYSFAELLSRLRAERQL